MILLDFDTRQLFQEDLKHAILSSDGETSQQFRRSSDRPIAAIRKELERLKDDDELSQDTLQRMEEAHISPEKWLPTSNHSTLYARAS